MLRLRKADVAGWIDTFSVPPDFEVEMRPGCVTTASGQTNGVTLLNLLTHLDPNGRQMSIPCRKWGHIRCDYTDLENQLSYWRHGGLYYCARAHCSCEVWVVISIAATHCMGARPTKKTYSRSDHCWRIDCRRQHGCSASIVRGCRF